MVLVSSLDLSTFLYRFSIADPSSIKSHMSDISYISNPSYKPVSNNQQNKSARRNPSSRTANNLNKTIQIDFNDRKVQKIMATKVNKVKTPKRQALPPKKKTPVKPHNGARRNLTFDDANTRKTPRKKSSLATPKKTSKTPKKTPKKNDTCKYQLDLLLDNFFSKYVYFFRHSS